MKLDSFNSQIEGDMPQPGAATILIVEDSEIQAELLRVTIASAGYKVLLARDGAQGLAMAREEQPSAVVSDVAMPVMNGYELCTHLREDPRLRETPVILLTALTQAQDVIHGLNAGADCYVTKPYDPLLLLSRLAALLAEPPTRAQGTLAMQASIDGTTHQVKAAPQLVLNLLIWTYEDAVRQNHQLQLAKDALEVSRLTLDRKVQERTLKLVRLNDELALEIERRQGLEKQLRELALLDPLTGLYNRRFLHDALEREGARSLRSEQPLGIIMLDIDFFKDINDRHGHLAGDLVLKWLGQFLRDGVRGEDVACRYGGEEFTLLVPGASRENAAQRAEQIRRGVQTESLLEFHGQVIGPITVSLGVSAYQKSSDKPGCVADALQAADLALYRAKQQGRNRLVLADMEDE
jgi:diguanylate cyclase (GGDEF)-like protein